MASTCLGCLTWSTDLPPPSASLCISLPRSPLSSTLQPPSFSDHGWTLTTLHLLSSHHLLGYCCSFVPIQTALAMLFNHGPVCVHMYTDTDTHTHITPPPLPPKKNNCHSKGQRGQRDKQRESGRWQKGRKGHVTEIRGDCGKSSEPRDFPKQETKRNDFLLLC